MISYYTT